VVRVVIKNFKYLIYATISFIVSMFVLASCSTTEPKAEVSIDQDPVKFVFQDDTIDIPSWEQLAQDLNVSENEIQALAKSFVGALSYGKRSEHYASLCDGKPERCESLDTFLDFMGDQQQARSKARRERRINERRMALRPSQAKVAQAMDMKRLLGGLTIRQESDFQVLAAQALKVETCPRNLSAVLSVRAVRFFPDPKIRDLARALFDHAEPCLSNADPSWESLYLRHGLVAISEGNIERAERLLIQSMEGPTRVEQYRSLYWLGWMAHKRGTQEANNRYWQILNAEFPLSYYSIQAITAWGRDPLDSVPERTPYKFVRKSQVRAELNQRIVWLELLMRMNERQHAKRWMEWLSSDVKNTEVDVVHYLSAISLKGGYYRQNIVFLIKYYRAHPDRIDRSGLRSLYPRPYFDDVHEEAKDKIHTNLVMGLIRQESAFDSQAVSSARAKGLMQIIPRTARRLLHGGDRMLFDQKANTQMGVKYLARLGDRFSGEVELALAAYNAGPNRVSEWLTRFPERDNSLLWNDLIPFMETRDYVVSILRNNYWYERLFPLENAPVGVLTSKVVEELKSAAIKTE
jgi:hypothetical protein